MGLLTHQDLRSVRSLLGDGLTVRHGIRPGGSCTCFSMPPERTSHSVLSSAEGPDKVVCDTPGTERGLGFSIPRFGGVVIWNSYSNEEAADSGGASCALSRTELQTTSDLWVSQLRQLIGVGVDASPTDGNVVVLRSRDGVTDWELDRLARSRLGYFTKRAVSSLSALSKLSLDMPHMAWAKRGASSHKH